MNKILFTKIVRESHRLTKEMKQEFPEINYKIQYGINFKWLYKIEKNKGKTKKTNRKPKIEIKVKNTETNEILTFLSKSEFHRFLKETFGGAGTQAVADLINGKREEYKGFILLNESDNKPQPEKKKFAEVSEEEIKRRLESLNRGFHKIII